MRLPALCAACLFVAIEPTAIGQMSDRCSPGWSTLNRLREQLTPEISTETLQLLKVRIEKDLTNCREIPDLWYYRALIDERIQDTKDAAYARKQAQAGGSDALGGNVNPFLQGASEQPTALSDRIGAKYALVVGINEFEHAPPLRFAANDARSVDRK